MLNRDFVFRPNSDMSNYAVIKTRALFSFLKVKKIEFEETSFIVVCADPNILTDHKFVCPICIKGQTSYGGKRYLQARYFDTMGMEESRDILDRSMSLDWEDNDDKIKDEELDETYVMKLFCCDTIANNSNDLDITITALENKFDVTLEPEDDNVTDETMLSNVTYIES